MSSFRRSVASAADSSDLSTSAAAKALSSRPNMDSDSCLIGAQGALSFCAKPGLNIQSGVRAPSGSLGHPGAGTLSEFGPSSSLLLDIISPLCSVAAELLASSDIASGSVLGFTEIASAFVLEFNEIASASVLEFNDIASASTLESLTSWALMVVLALLVVVILHLCCTCAMSQNGV